MPRAAAHPPPSAPPLAQLEELLGQRVGLRRLHAARRARKLDPFLSIRDFDRADAHQLLTGGADPNGWGRRWIRLARTGHDHCRLMVME